MITGTNESIVYTPLPISVGGFKDESIVSLHAEGSIGYFRYLSIRDEKFKVWKHDYAITKDADLFINLPDISYLGFSYTLKNDFHCEVDGFGKSLCIKDHYNLTYLPRINVGYQFKKGEHTQFGIEFAEEYFKELTDYVQLLYEFINMTHAKTPAIVSQRNLTMSRAMLQIISSFWLDLEKGDFTKMYMQSKTLELIRLSLERFKKSNFGIPIKLTPKEEETIKLILDYLMNHLDQNISIGYAAAMYDFNEQKLARGFKALNGIDLGDYLHEERMQRAYYLLKVDKKSVKQASSAVGYKYQQNFSTAFGKYFGYPPSILANDC